MHIWVNTPRVIETCSKVRQYCTRMIAFRRDEPDGGKPGAEAASLARLAGDLELCLVATQHVLDDGQSQTGASGFTRPPPVHPIKSFRETRDMFGFDPYAV